MQPTVISSSDVGDLVIMTLSLSAVRDKETWTESRKRKASTFKQGMGVNQAMIADVRNKIQGMEAPVADALQDRNLVAIQLVVAVNWSQREVKFHRNPYLKTTWVKAKQLCQELLGTFEGLTKPIHNKDDDGEPAAEPGKELADMQGFQNELKSELDIVKTLRQDLEDQLTSLRGDAEKSNGEDREGFKERLGNLKTNFDDLQSHMLSANMVNAKIKDDLQQPTMNNALIGNGLKNLRSNMENLQKQLDQANQANSNLDCRLKELNTIINKNSKVSPSSADDFTSAFSALSPKKSKNADEVFSIDSSSACQVSSVQNNKQKAPLRPAEDFTSAFSALSATPNQNKKSKSDCGDFSIDSSAGKVSSASASLVSGNFDAKGTPNEAQNTGPVMGNGTVRNRSLGAVADVKGAFDDESDSETVETASDLPSLASSVSTFSFQKVFAEDAASHARKQTSPVPKAKKEPKGIQESSISARASKNDDYDSTARPAVVENFTKAFSALSGPTRPKKKADELNESVDSSIETIPLGSSIPASEETDRLVQSKARTKQSTLGPQRAGKADDFADAFSALSRIKSKMKHTDDDSVDSSVASIATVSTANMKKIGVPDKSPKKEARTTPEPTQKAANSTNPLKESEKAEDFTKAFSALSGPKKQAVADEKSEEGIDSSVSSIPSASFRSDAEIEHGKVSRGDSPSDKSKLGMQGTGAHKEVPEKKADEFAKAFSAASTPRPVSKQEENDNGIDSSSIMSSNVAEKGEGTARPPKESEKAEDFAKAFSALSGPKKQAVADEKSEEGIDSSVSSIPSASFRSDEEIEHGKVSMLSPGQQLGKVQGSGTAAKTGPEEVKKGAPDKKADEFAKAFSAINVPSRQGSSSNNDTKIDSDVMSALTTDKEIASHAEPQNLVDVTKAASARISPSTRKKEQDDVDIDSTSNSIVSSNFVRKLDQVAIAEHSNTAQGDAKGREKVDDFTKVFSALSSPTKQETKEEVSDAVDSSVGTVPSASFKSDSDSQRETTREAQGKDQRGPSDVASTIDCGVPPSTKNMDNECAQDRSHASAEIALAEAAGEEEEAFYSRGKSLSDKLKAMEKKLQVDKDMVVNAEKIMASILMNEMEASLAGDDDDNSAALSVEDISIMSGVPDSLPSSHDSVSSMDELFRDLESSYHDNDTSSQPKEILSNPTKKQEPARNRQRSVRTVPNTEDTAKRADSSKWGDVREPEEVGSKQRRPQKVLVETEEVSPQTKKWLELDNAPAVDNALVKTVTGEGDEDERSPRLKNHLETESPENAANLSVSSLADLESSVEAPRRLATKSTTASKVTASISSSSTEQSQDQIMASDELSNILAKEAELYTSRFNFDDDSLSDELSLESISESSEELYQEPRIIEETAETTATRWKSTPDHEQGSVSLAASSVSVSLAASSVDSQSEAHHTQVSAEGSVNSFAARSARLKVQEVESPANVEDGLPAEDEKVKGDNSSASAASGASLVDASVKSSENASIEEPLPSSVDSPEPASPKTSTAEPTSTSENGFSGIALEAVNKKAKPSIAEPSGEEKPAVGLNLSSDDKENQPAAAPVANRNPARVTETDVTSRAEPKRNHLNAATTARKGDIASAFSDAADKALATHSSPNDSNEDLSPSTRESEETMNEPTAPFREEAEAAAFRHEPTTSSAAGEEAGALFGEEAGVLFGKEAEVAAPSNEPATSSAAGVQARVLIGEDAEVAAPRQESATSSAAGKQAKMLIGEEAEVAAPRNFLDEFMKPQLSDPAGFMPASDDDYKNDSFGSYNSNVSVVSVKSDLTGSTGDFEGGAHDSPVDIAVPANEEVAAESKLPNEILVGVDSSKISLSNSGLESVELLTRRKHVAVALGEEEKIDEDLFVGHPFDEHSEFSFELENHASSDNQLPSNEKASFHLHLPSTAGTTATSGEVRPLGKLTDVNDAFNRLNRIKDRLRGLRLLMDTDEEPSKTEKRHGVDSNQSLQSLPLFPASEGLDATSDALAHFSRQFQSASDAHQAIQHPKGPTDSSPIDEAYSALLRAQSKLRSLRALSRARNAHFG